MERFFQVTGNKNNFRVRAGFAQPIGKVPSAHLRHDHVGQKKIDFSFAALGEKLLRIIAVRGFDHIVAKPAKDSNGNVPDADVIFEDENGFSS